MRNAIGTIALAISVCALIANRGLAGPPPPIFAGPLAAQMASADSGLGARLECRMSLDAPGPVVHAGQAIRVRFTFKNISDRPLHVLRLRSPFSPRHNGQFVVTRADGTPVPWSRPVAALAIARPTSPSPSTPQTSESPTARSYKTIPAGGTSQATVSLTEGEGRYLLDEPGRYTIAWRGELHQVQDGAQPVPRPPSPSDNVHVECAPVTVEIVATP